MCVKGLRFDDEFIYAVDKVFKNIRDLPKSICLEKSHNFTIEDHKNTGTDLKGFLKHQSTSKKINDILNLLF